MGRGMTRRHWRLSSRGRRCCYQPARSSVEQNSQSPRSSNHRRNGTHVPTPCLIIILVQEGKENLSADWKSNGPRHSCSIVVAEIEASKQCQYTFFMNGARVNKSVQNVATRVVAMDYGKIVRRNRLRPRNMGDIALQNGKRYSV